jgi:hypothetical protein
MQAGKRAKDSNGTRTSIAVSERTRQRVERNRLVPGEILENVVERALEALEEKPRLEASS